MPSRNCMNLIDWWNIRRNAKLERKLRQENQVDFEKPADMQYPPPSAYEVNQLNSELEPYHAVSGIVKENNHGK